MRLGIDERWGGGKVITFCGIRKILVAEDEDKIAGYIAAFSVLSPAAMVGNYLLGQENEEIHFLAGVWWSFSFPWFLLSSYT